MINKIKRGRWRGEERVECGDFKENCNQMTESLGRNVGSMHTVMRISIGQYGIHPFLTHTFLTPCVAFQWPVVTCEIVI
jgi:hypothetical protein